MVNNLVQLWTMLWLATRGPHMCGVVEATWGHCCLGIILRDALAMIVEV